jgi:hypothetical protein
VLLTCLLMGDPGARLCRSAFARKVGDHRSERDPWGGAKNSFVGRLLVPTRRRRQAENHPRHK